MEGGNIMEEQNQQNFIPMVDLKEEVNLMGQSIIKSVTDVIESGAYVLGEKGKKLEHELAGYLNVSYALGVANGTDALYIALKALGIGIGDEVITTPFTFFGTAEAIAQAGAKPVFADIDEETYNIDPYKMEKAITPKTKAIIVVHLFGLSAKMSQIMEIAKKHHIKVIEDACQAIGTEYQGKRVGSIGDIGCFSFFPSKNLGAFGDAGLVVTNNKDLYKNMFMLRNHGSDKKYLHSLIGMNSRLDEIQAAILLVKLKYFDVFLHLRKEIAKNYTENIHKSLKKPKIYENREHTFHQYCIELDQRNELSAYLLEKGISSAIYYPVPLHLQEAFSYLNYKEGDFPLAETIAKRILALPISPTMSREIQENIINCVNEFLEEKGSK